MNPAVIWDAVAGIARTVNAVLSFIPALVWAIALALALGYGGVMHLERDSAVKAKNEAIGVKQQIEAQLAQQKKEAAAKLAALTKERDAAQAELDHAHQAQEIESEKRRNDSKAASAALAADAARNGGRLRDPNAGRGSCGAGPQAQAAAPAASGAGSGAETGGLLSEPLTRLLQRITAESQQVNDAYAACRADDLSIRKALEPAP